MIAPKMSPEARPHAENVRARVSLKVGTVDGMRKVTVKINIAGRTEAGER